ncbi:MerR family transcriptional regulator [Auritidibacter ignavus]|uniref:MerR family transcriptional regulator n=1 Tax=Auritidibacter ignavus TaxID=678932 RepID=UPI002447D356|nr:MerR family transcriptional regulator [Auritidibacter ignavus]WGH81384.1 MerR family transcriptional regulator [Auritidibacter ignavus]WHS35578.1 MerR family transcriptional regulator [Auritidibacter ignavus]
MSMHTPESMTPWVTHSSATTLPPDDVETLSVGDAAALVGVSVRTLHHWDDISLVAPKYRSRSGYRAYDSDDIDRIHRVLVYRELGLSLASIQKILDDPTVDEDQQLRQQRQIIGDRIDRLSEMAAGIDRLLAARGAGTRLSMREQAEIFGQDWQPEWAEEAYERWGDSREWTQFEQNTAHLSASERARIHDQSEAVKRELVEAKRAGVEPGTVEANQLAEAHRGAISQLFACSHSMHACMGRRYVEDERFSANIDQWEPGMSMWLRDVIFANAAAHGVDPAQANWE